MRPLLCVPFLACTIGTVAAQGFCAAPPITAVAVSPDGGTLVTGSQSGVIRYRWPGLEQGEPIACEIEQIADLEFSPDGTQLAIAGGEPAISGAVVVVDVESGRLVLREAQHTDLVYSVAWHPQGNSLVTAGLDHRLLHIATAHDSVGSRVLQEYRGHSRGVTSVTFLSASQLLSGGRDNNLRRWDLASGQLERSFNNHTAPVHDLALRPPSADGPTLPIVCSVSDDRTVRFWAPTIGRMMRFVRLEDSLPLAAAWSPDGRRVAVSTSGGELIVIDPDTAEVVRSTPVLEGWAYALAYHPVDSVVVVGGSDGALRSVEVGRP